MRELKLIEDDETVSRTVEPPSYFEYQSARSLPGDKIMKQYRADLARTHLAAQIEDQLRRQVSKKLRKR